MSETDSGSNPGDLPGAEAYADGTLVRDPEPDQPLSEEEFDPNGTLALLFVYFLIIVLMWIHMYFFEFLGNGPTVIG